MQSGNLRDRITIRRRTETKNAGGGLDIGWTDVASVWASVRPQTATTARSEMVVGGILQGVSYFDISIRYRADVEVADQILWDGRELNVLNAEDKAGTQQWTVILASTQTPQGA